MYNLDKIIEDCMIGEVSSSTSKELVKESLLQFGRECFEAGREFDSKDGIVDIDIVIFYKGADNSDLTPKFPLFDDFINSVDNG